MFMLTINHILDSDTNFAFFWAKKWFNVLPEGIRKSNKNKIV